MKLHIFTNRINHDTAHAALGFAGLAASWQPGERDGELVVDIAPSDLNYLPDMFAELVAGDIRFTFASSEPVPTGSLLEPPIERRRAYPDFHTEGYRRMQRALKR